jgi:hypothetical protein
MVKSFYYMSCHSLCCGINPLHVYTGKPNLSFGDVLFLVDQDCDIPGQHHSIPATVNAGAGSLSPKVNSCWEIAIMNEKNHLHIRRLTSVLKHRLPPTSLLNFFLDDSIAERSVARDCAVFVCSY